MQFSKCCFGEMKWCPALPSSINSSQLFWSLFPGWADYCTGYDKCALCLVAQSCLTLRDPMDSSPPGSSVHGDSSGRNTAVGCYVLLQGIFPTEGLNPGLLHCRQILYHLSHQGSPDIINRLWGKVICVWKIIFI